MNELQRETTASTDAAQATPMTPAEQRPRYVEPSVVTLTDRQLLAELGPAQMGGYFIPFDEIP